MFLTAVCITHIYHNCTNYGIPYCTHIEGTWFV